MKTIENLNTMVAGKRYAGWVIDHEKHSVFPTWLILVEKTSHKCVVAIVGCNYEVVVLDEDHEVVLSKTDHEWTHYSGGRYSIIVYEDEGEEN